MKPQKKFSSDAVLRKVVMLDDSPDAVRSLASRLEQRGYMVHHLALRKTAPFEVVRLKPDAVLLNIGLPAVANGLASELRKKLKTRRTRIIGISLSEKMDRSFSTKSDFDHCFVMPRDEENLLAVLRLPQRVLLVEDNDLLAEVTADFMRAAGVEVRRAESGEEALQTAIVFRPDIVLCDLSLPGMSGLDVVRALRASPHTKHARLALYTAMSDIELRVIERQMRADVVDFFLAKPLTPEKLNELLGAQETLQSTRSKA